MHLTRLSCLLFFSCATQLPESPLQEPAIPPVISSSSTPAEVLGESEGGKANIPGTSMQMMSRATTRRVAPGDALGVVLHWEGSDGPLKQMSDTEPPAWSASKTIASFEFKITAPDKKLSTHRATWTDTHSPREDRGLYYEPTFFLLLSKSGIWEGSGFDGAWVGAAPDLSQVGVYQIEVSGSLAVSTPLKFTSPPVSIEVSPSAPTFAALEKVALEERAKMMPGASWLTHRGGRATESGFIPGVVIEDESGALLYRSARVPVRFGYSLITARFDSSGTLLTQEKQEVNTCIAEGTLIEAADGLRPIEEISVGDQVWGYSLSAGERVLVTVEEVSDASADRFVSFGGLTVTPEHPVFSEGQWRAAGDISTGSSLTLSHGEGRAQPLYFSSSPMRVFDLDVSETDNFFAGGVLVHNKDRSYLYWLDDPWFFMWDPSRPDR